MAFTFTTAEQASGGTVTPFAGRATIAYAIQALRPCAAPQPDAAPDRSDGYRCPLPRSVRLTTIIARLF